MRPDLQELAVLGSGALNLMICKVNGLTVSIFAGNIDIQLRDCYQYKVYAHTVGFESLGLISFIETLSPKHRGYQSLKIIEWIGIEPKPCLDRL